MLEPKLNKDFLEIIWKIGKLYSVVPISIYEPSQKREERFGAYISKLRFSQKRRHRLSKIEKIKSKIM